MTNSGKTYLAFDLGASSGRAILGFMENDRLRIEEINRFANAPLELGGTLYWNFLSLWSDVVDSLRLCSRHCSGKLSGIGIDTWGVDFGLLDADDKLLSNPICYRDDSTIGIEQFMSSAVGKREFYRLTGLQPSRIGTLPQLVALNKASGAGKLSCARTLLMMSDLFRYFLCGNKSIELTAVGGSQLVNINKKAWCSKLLKTFGVPRRIMPKIIRPGTTVGRLHPRLATSTGLNRVPIIAVAGHDTASASAAAPFVDRDSAFISSGTWSVVGVIQDQAVTTSQALKCGFVNEFGLDSILFVKNLMGLYLFENLRRSLLSQGCRVTYAKMIDAVLQTKPFGRFLDINSPVFFVSGDPVSSAKQFLACTGQKGVQNWPQVCRAMLEGLAFSYRQTIDDLRKITQRTFKRICVVGGGSRNKLLCQMTADATGLEVIAGPAEATAAGNLGTQALATGELNNSSDIRTLVQNSFSLKTYKPKDRKSWDKNFNRYLEIVDKSNKLRY